MTTLPDSNLKGSSHQLRGLPDEHIQFIQNVIARYGPEPHEYEALARWFQRTSELVGEGRITQAAVSAFWREVTAVFFHGSMQGHVVRKPHGYAGDFEIIDQIYLCQISDDEHLRRWDAYFHAQHAPRAVRNRKTYFHDLLRRKLAETTLRPLRVLNVASGPGRDIAEWCATQGNDDVHFDCVEMDAKAIAHAQNVCVSCNGGVRFFCANALRFNTTDKYDLVWSAGLFDYLNDGLFVRLLSRLIRFTREGGEVVIGNFGDFNPSRPYMELLGDWHLIHRSANHLLSLAELAKLSSPENYVGKDSSAVNLFLHLHK